MSGRLSKVLVYAVGVVAVAGCTTTSSGSPKPAPDSSQESSTETSTESTSPEDSLPSDGAPKVENPMDTAAYQDDPCRALKSEQATELNIPPNGERDDTDFGPACTWKNPELNGGELVLQFFTEDPRGLSSAYKSDKNGEFKFFDPIEVEGQPAVAYSIVEPTAHCNVTVGATDELTFDITTFLSTANIGKVDPCEIAADVAGTFVQNMRDGV